EGDWPAAARVDRYVRHAPGAGRNAFDALHAFARWPTWMWANREVATFVEWLHLHNAALPARERVGFHGLDVYSLWESMSAVVGYLDRHDPEAGRRARRAYACFAPYGEDAEAYAAATTLVPASCEDAVVRVLTELRAAPDASGGLDARFDAEQNALVAKNAERYYRAMVRGGAMSWNVRDWHMVETLERLTARYGARSKAIVWAHNTHVGDARYTDMHAEGEVNVGQLVRERRARDGVVLVGFSTHRGRVVAAEEWGAPMQRLRVPEARPGSVEDALHRVDVPVALYVFSEITTGPELLEPRGHRAIGVVYRPEYERFGNYVPSVLPRRYDALVHVDITSPTAALHADSSPPAHDTPETYPFGV
ncbi:MAG TPA: erythromycin esterase family protein, partial [Byssovorax sp.]